MDAITMLRTALSSLWMNKMRTSLTLLGIVIGVAAVISLMGIGRGAQQSIVDDITSLGTDLIFVHPEYGGPVFFSEGGQAGRDIIGPGRPGIPGGGGGGGARAELTLEDAYALLDPVYAPSVRAVAPEVNSGGQLIAGRRNTWTSIIGTTPDYLSVRNVGMASGSFISNVHVQARAEVVVLGSAVAEQLFGMRDPSGQTVRINGRDYTVLGVLESVGGNSGGYFDHQVVVPVTTAYYRIDGRPSVAGGMPVQTINVEAHGADAVDGAMEEINSILTLRHRVTDTPTFSVTSQQQMIDALRGTMDTLLVFLAAIAGISLVVGGIGIMNIMLVSVTERTREIGIRKAVGAKRHDILFQFSTEAVFLSLAGGAIGIATGFILATVATSLGAFGAIGGGGGPEGPEGFRAVFTADIALLALAVSGGIGLFFGIYPAMRAASLQPVEALRHA